MQRAVRERRWKKKKGKEFESKDASEGASEEEGLKTERKTEKGISREGC